MGRRIIGSDPGPVAPRQKWLLYSPAPFNQKLGYSINLDRRRQGSQQFHSMATSSKAKKKTVRIASGLKRVRQDVRLNAANSALRSKFRTVVKNVQKAVAAGDSAKATELFKTAQSVIDSVADKGIFHKNKAARHKSRLSAKVKALAVPPQTATTA
jgi:small subunit ribosomal protein S20